MTQSFFGNLFGNGSAHALLQEQLLQLIGATRSLQQGIRQGDQSAQLELGSLSGPLRELCQEFNTVLALLGERLSNTLATISANQTLYDENLRVRKALDGASTNVMIADTNLDIVYMNEAVLAMLGQAESDIRKDLPNFDVRQLMGKNIDTFHKDPSHQRSMLAKLNSTYRAQITVGGRIFSLIANPVFNDTGERLGSVVEWADRTKEVMIEKEMSDIVQAVINGELHRRMELTGKSGFFQAMGEGINQIAEVIDSTLNDVIRVVQCLAKGDLTQQIEADYPGIFGTTKDSLNTTIASLTKIVTEVRGASDNLSSAAEQVSATAQSISQSSSEQASSMEETSASIEQMSASINQNTDNAQVTDGMASKAAKEAIKQARQEQKLLDEFATFRYFHRQAES